MIKLNALLDRLCSPPAPIVFVIKNNKKSGTETVFHMKTVKKLTDFCGRMHTCIAIAMWLPAIFANTDYERATTNNFK